jgi:hypothetical protein
MWNGESPPLQLTPFFHLEEAGNDEVVYVLAGLGSDPMYKAPGIIEPRRPDPLMAQLTERAPFLLKPEASITVSRAPDADRRYRDLVDMALADGLVTAGEATRLAAHRAELGLSEAEAEKIHEALGWSGAPSAPPAAASIPVVVPERVPDRAGVSVARDAPREGIEYAVTVPAVPVVAATEASRGAWPDAGRSLVAAVRDALTGALSFDPELVLMDEEIDVGQGELWIELQPSRGVSLWFPDSRKQLRDGQVQLAVGFYSQNQRRDPAYRAARSRLEGGEAPVVPAGWSALTSERTLLGSPLAFETSRRFPIEALAERETVDEVTRVVVSLAERAHGVLDESEADDGDVDARAREPLAVTNPPVAREVPVDFELSPLDGDPRIHGSVWIARILWALEWAARHGADPKSASDIARILSDNGVRVPPTNTARAFRTPRDDPRRTGLCEEIGEQRYVISASGRRALFELLAGE